MGRSRDLANLLNSSGLVPDAKVLALAASKLTGQLADANAPSGSVIQVVHAIKTDAAVMSSLTAVWTAVTGLSATITPQSASSKILVLLNVGMQGSGGASTSRGRVTRNGSAIAIGDASSARPRGIGQIYHFVGGQSEGGFTQGFISMTHVDSPASTAPQTYQFEIGGDNGGTVYVNRTQNDRDSAGYNDIRGVSTLTIMEIAG